MIPETREIVGMSVKLVPKDRKETKVYKDPPAHKGLKVIKVYKGLKETKVFRENAVTHSRFQRLTAAWPPCWPM